MYKTIFFVLLVAAFTQCTIVENPLSDAFINKINRLQSSWKAGRNFDENTPMQNIKSLLGTIPTTKQVLQDKKSDIIPNLPENFDSREQWPKCKTIGEIRDQSICGSCWAFGAVEAMSDRICIMSNASIQVSLSANDLISCCSSCGSGCNGGDGKSAWDYWIDHGIVTGGGFGSKSGCQSYVFPECEHHTTGSHPGCGSTDETPKCTKKCDEGTGIDYEGAKYYGKSSYYMEDDERVIASEIYQYGPVQAKMIVYEDFLSYKSGVYEHTIGGITGSHSVKILGWGVENGKKYWLVANSWNRDWGDKGFFKILRGADESSIEFGSCAGLPKLR